MQGFFLYVILFACKDIDHQTTTLIVNRSIEPGLMLREAHSEPDDYAVRS